MKLPRTLHIESSGLSSPLDPEVKQFSKLADEFLYVEEKLDGTGVSIFFDEQLQPQIWHRGSPVTGKEFHRLHAWVTLHQDELFSLLEDRYVLFGEWMLHKHAIFYDRLSTYFFESDVYDKKTDLWLSTYARTNLMAKHEYIRHVPVLAAFRPTKLSQLTSLVKRSMFQSEHWREVLWKKSEKEKFELAKILEQCDQSDLAEGLYIKHEDEEQVIGRYKYVRPAFVENIISSGTHLIDRIPFYNISVQGELV
jgi:ATP-dependent RNA circularization protein (DNA/RNA ligase family)